LGVKVTQFTLVFGSHTCWSVPLFCRFKVSVVLCPLTSVAESAAGKAVILEFNEGGGVEGGTVGGDAGGGGGGVTEADGDVTGGGGGDAGGGEVAPDCVTFTMRGTVIRRELPDPVSQM
jgi:hypothetical protein